MQTVVLCNDALKAELGNNISENEEVIYINNINEILQYQHADVFIDLLFVNSPERINILMQLLPKLVIINSVADALSEIHPQFIRINGWPTFLQTPVMEATCLDNNLKANTEKVFQQLNKTIEWLPDEIGFITPRVISMIINEAYFALSEGVSTKQEIDTAMKLGTNHPYGPFEWAEKIGLKKVVALLYKLGDHHSRYKPCALLMQEADAT